MILGLSTATFTLLHVLISLVGLAAGFVVLFGLMAGRRLDGWTALFLATTVTGFGFPFDHRPFAIAQGLVLLSFIVLGAIATSRFPPQGAGAR